MLKDGQDLTAGSSTVREESDIRRLSQRIVDGDESAFETFFNGYSPRLYAFLLVLTSGDEHLAREVQQIVFIRVAGRFRMFDSESRLWAWLNTVARNAFVDILRKEGRHTRRCQEAFEDPNAHVGWNEDTRPDELVAEALARLPEDERHLIDLFYFSDDTQSELASRLGVTLKAFQSKLARIRAKLRTILCSALTHHE